MAHVAQALTGHAKHSLVFLNCSGKYAFHAKRLALACGISAGITPALNQGVQVAATPARNLVEAVNMLVHKRFFHLICVGCDAFGSCLVLIRHNVTR